MQRHKAVFPTMKGSKDFPYAEVASPITLKCYEKLVENSSCCVDEQVTPGVRRVEYRREGTEWECDNNNKACLDDKKGKRGYDTVWFPQGATCRSPRVLYIHGGSWMYGSPDSLGYGIFASKLAALSGAIVMLPDYPLIPKGNFTTILRAVGGALSWLADYGPWKPSECTDDHPPVFIGGDSSGGGTGLALLLEQKRAPHLFHVIPDDLTGRLVAGAFFFSPWTNLVCNTPDYYHHAFAEIVDSTTLRNRNASFFVGDIVFHGHPDQNAGGFQINSEDYVGDPELMMDPLASPFYAGASELAGGGLPPLYFAVGASESIMGDTVIFAQKAAAYGAEVNLDIYEGMWHVFPMYSEGCGSGSELWPAIRALNNTAMHIRKVARSGHPLRETVRGTVSTNFVYDQSLQFRWNWFAPEKAPDAEDRPLQALPAPAPAKEPQDVVLLEERPAPAAPRQRSRSPAEWLAAEWLAASQAHAATATTNLLLGATALLCAASVAVGAFGVLALQALLARSRSSEGTAGLLPARVPLLRDSPLLRIEAVP